MEQIRKAKGHVLVFVHQRLDRGRRLAALFEKKGDAGTAEPRRG